MGATTLQDYAIVIGIRYASESGLKALAGTLSDATAFTEWLRSKDGGNVPKENIALILSPEKQPSQQSALPLKDQIDDALRQIGISGSKKPIGRRLYFYFSGHGFGPKPSEICMLMARATNRELNANIGLSLYRDLLRTLATFQEVVYIIDCCRNPTPPAQGVNAGPPSFTPDVAVPADLVSDVVVAAAPAGFESFETTELKTRRRRGLLTMALLTVLTSPVGVDQQGQHTAFNLQRNLRDRIKAILANNGISEVNQQAVLNIQDDRDTKLVLGKPEIKPVPVRVVAPDGMKGKLAVLENNVTLIEERDAGAATIAQSPWVVNLCPTKLYSVRHTHGDDPSSDAPIDWSVLAATSKDDEYVCVLPNA